MRFLQSSAMLALVVTASAAFYELSPPGIKLIDLDAPGVTWAGLGR